MTELQKYVVDLLDNYKRNQSLLRLSCLDEIIVPISHLSETPRSITNKFFSNTESQAFCVKNKNEVKGEILKVEAWLYILKNDERYILEQIFFEKKSYIQIALGWEKITGLILSRATLKNKRRDAIDAICKIEIEAYHLSKKESSG